MFTPSLSICRMAGSPGSVAGILTMTLGRLTPPVGGRGEGYGLIGVVGGGGRDLDADEAVASLGLFVDRPVDVGRRLDVLDHQLPEDVLRLVAGLHQVDQRP